MTQHFQGTLAKSIRFSGPGLHTAGHHLMHLQPAPENSGIVFRRHTKTGKVIETRASWQHIKALPLCSCIALDAAHHVRTIEHLMAAFYACGIDNVMIDIEGDEVPVLDGSALPFIQQIDNAGVIKQKTKRSIFTVTQRSSYTEKDRSICIEPADALYIDITISLAKMGRLNWSGKITPERFKEEISAARTFGRLKNGLLAQLTRFRKDPICLGANTQTALVIVGDKVINKGGLRMTDEYICHRVLDLVGDLMLVGGHIHGKITASSTAHRLNHGLIRTIFKNEGWKSTTGVATL